MRARGSGLRRGASVPDFALFVLYALFSAGVSRAAGPPVDPARTPVSMTATRTFCAEWVRQSREGYERVTLFADGNVVWKRSRDGKEDVLRKAIPQDELAFYCSYFSRPEVWTLSENLRTGLSGEFSTQSVLTLVRENGDRKILHFDEMSPLPGEAAAIRAALEGLKSLLTSPLAPASRFAPDALAAGQLLKRFDGAVFRIHRIDKEKGIVELEGVSEPYREFRKIEELRFQFSPPE